MRHRNTDRAIVRHRSSATQAPGSTLVMTVALACLIVTSVFAQPSSYVIGSPDVLSITIWNQEDLTGRYIVEIDGTFTFPLVGRVQAAGLTLRDFEEALKALLADGFFKNPQVTVVVEEYRSQRVFVVGEVRQPGTYPLTGGMRLIEALATAGSTLVTASGEVVVVRAPGTGGPVLPGQDKTAEVISVNLRELQSSATSQNVELSDGDTIFVPLAETIYVFGQVRNPGSYPIQKDTTVLQALSLAGGVTEFGATNRINIVRLVDGEQVEVRVKLNDLVSPSDTIMVPERFF
jgi:polysaccharide export outer membrane protein